MAGTEPEFELTLDPFGTAAAQAAPAPAPTLTAEQPEPAPSQEAQTIARMEEQLSENEKTQVEAFAKKINIADTKQTLEYGAQAQKKIADFSDRALANVRTKDFGETGEMISDLVGELKNFNGDLEDKNRGLFSRLGRKSKKNIDTIKAKYDKANTSVESIVGVLEGHQVTLLKDVAMLDQLYSENLVYYKEVTMYILAGKKALENARATTLVELKRKAEQTGAPEDAQKANDYAQLCDRFEKKIYDLELSRMVSIQMAPQVRLLQNNDTQLSEKIHTTIVNTIPLWKSQMVIALGLAHAEQAMAAERAVTDMTNELLKKNAERLHQATVSVARESERGIIDIETLVHTNQELITTMEEVQQIQAEGREKRRAAEAELGRMESELKRKLLEINMGNPTAKQ